MFNQNPFYGGQPNPWQVPFTQQQAQQAVAPRQQMPMMPPGQGNPMLPQQGPQPPTPPMGPPMQPPQQSGGVGAFLGSPGAAMASQAMNNMFAMRRGQAPQMDPIQAYQRSVNQQAVMSQRDKEMDLREQTQARYEAAEARAAEKFAIDKDPAYAFKKLKAEGIIPETMTYPEFEVINSRRNFGTSPQQNMATIDAMQAEIDATDDPAEKQKLRDRKKLFENFVRAPTNVDTGGGGVTRFGAGPDGQQLVTPANATARNAAEAGAKTGAQEQAKTREQQVRGAMSDASSARIAYRKAEDLMAVTDKWIAKFAEGEDTIDTGFVPNMMLKAFGIGSEELGDLNAETIRQAMAGLKLANLAPVTEQEFAAVMQMWAEISKSPTVNRGALGNAKMKTRELMTMIQEDAIYSAGIMEEYGTESQNRGFLKTNRFVSDLLKEEPQVDF